VRLKFTNKIFIPWVSHTEINQIVGVRDGFIFLIKAKMGRIDKHTRDKRKVGGCVIESCYWGKLAHVFILSIIQ